MYLWKKQQNRPSFHVHSNTCPTGSVDFSCTLLYNCTSVYIIVYTVSCWTSRRFRVVYVSCSRCYMHPPFTRVLIYPQESQNKTKQNNNNNNLFSYIYRKLKPNNHVSLSLKPGKSKIQRVTCPKCPGQLSTAQSTLSPRSETVLLSSTWFLHPKEQLGQCLTFRPRFPTSITASMIISSL